MGSAAPQGYQAVFEGLRTRSRQAGSSAQHLWELHDALSRTFYEEGNPLGDDQYGAELEKNRVKIETAVLGAFTDYIYEVEYLRDGLRDNSRVYEEAEDPWGPGGVPDLSMDDSAYDDPAHRQGW
ncbi:hypothetical protein [Nonomuraea harbinensis]|uniref:Uncharacterized protein n=1 Tax=Nonomuraea harbinensis TaxID=1286938 RepID=A0ABW1BMK9_9ACTN|nr:hypothetical protein [Nonomuraea harbinensis]